MSAIRFGTPVVAWRSEYGRSPHRPIAHSLTSSRSSSSPRRPSNPWLVATATFSVAMASSVTPIHTNFFMARDDSDYDRRRCDVLVTGLQTERGWRFNEVVDRRGRDDSCG